MCRLLGYVSAKPVTLPEFAGPDFSNFVKLSEIHKDSWGICLVEDERARLLKVAETAASSEQFDTILSERTATGGLLHFRWASPGIQVTQENAHPFSYEDFAFIHNGALQPYDALLPEISPANLALRRGSGDSELFFLFALTKIQLEGFRSGVISAVSEIKSKYSYSSINSMFLNRDYLIVVSENHPENRPPWADDHYYELRYRIDEGGCLVTSSGWNQVGWTLIENHSALIVDRKSLKTELIKL